MNTKQQTIAILVLIVSLVISSCGLESSSSSPISELLPMSTSTPKPTPKPFVDPVAIGAWVGDISIPLDPDESESANIRLLILNNKTIDYYQLYLTSCSLVVGDNSLPIDQGTFSFSIEQSCSFSGAISISGVFVSEDKLEGTVKVGTQTSYWEAAPAK